MSGKESGFMLYQLEYTSRKVLFGKDLLMEAEFCKMKILVNASQNELWKFLRLRPLFDIVRLCDRPRPFWISRCIWPSQWLLEWQRANDILFLDTYIWPGQLRHLLAWFRIKFHIRFTKFYGGLRRETLGYRIDRDCPLCLKKHWVGGALLQLIPTAWNLKIDKTNAGPSPGYQCLAPM